MAGRHPSALLLHLPTPVRSPLQLPAARPAPRPQVHGFKVMQHEKCRVRVTVSKKAGVVPQEGHKVCTGVLHCTALYCIAPVCVPRKETQGLGWLRWGRNMRG